MVNLQMIIKPIFLYLKDHFCTYFTSWDQNVRDTPGSINGKENLIHCWQSMLCRSSIHFVSSMIIQKVTKGRPTPFAHVADNDLAVGYL